MLFAENARHCAAVKAEDLRHAEAVQAELAVHSKNVSDLADETDSEESVEAEEPKVKAPKAVNAPEDAPEAKKAPKRAPKRAPKKRPGHAVDMVGKHVTHDEVEYVVAAYIPEASSPVKYPLFEIRNVATGVVCRIKSSELF